MEREEEGTRGDETECAEDRYTRKKEERTRKITSHNDDSIRQEKRGQTKKGITSPLLLYDFV